MALSSLADCRTADDVRRNARQVYQRQHARDYPPRQVVSVPQPSPHHSELSQPQPEEIKPKGKRPSQISDEQIIELIKYERDRVRGLMAKVDQDDEIRPSVREVQDAICFEFNITRIDLIGVSHLRKFTRPRHASYLLCKVLTGFSLPTIGRLHGGRDHTTVLHGVRKLAWLREVLLGELALSGPVDVWVSRAKHHLEAAG